MATGSRTRNRAAQAERSRATSRRIVAAATELFVQDGYLQTTMAEIARQAGVAVQTLYLSFGSKAALLSAAFDVAIAGDDEPLPVLRRPWYSRLREEPDAATALGLFVEQATHIIDRVYPLYAALMTASADPEVAEVLARSKQQRFETFSTILGEISGKAGFNRRLPVRRAVEVLYAVLSEETYGLLVAENQWTVPDWASWVARSVGSEIFTPEHHVRP